jgi:hypothetical protein
MKRLTVLASITVFLFAGIQAAKAEEKFGVKVYGGATYDVSTSKAVSESFSVKASCYRTKDTAAKVTEFYKNQAGLELLGESQEGAMFKRADVDITIQNPWMDMKSGQMNKDTLISIVKHK